MKAFAALLTGTVLGCLLLNGQSLGAAASDMTQSVAGGGVTVKVTYLNPKVADELRFQIVLDTHSVNLDAYDLKSIALLREDTGKSYAPESAENKGGGHHREAVLSFPKLTPG